MRVSLIILNGNSLPLYKRPREETFGPGTLAINPTPGGSKEKVSNLAWLVADFSGGLGRGYYVRGKGKRRVGARFFPVLCGLDAFCGRLQLRWFMRAGRRQLLCRDGMGAAGGEPDYLGFS
jgi:hypothetical protein